MLKQIKTYPLTIIVIIAIFYFSFFTPPKVKTIEVPFFDKWGHMCMYLGLSSMLWFEYLRTHKEHFKFKNIIPVAIIFPIALGGLIELGQKYFTTHRDGEWADFAANTLGVFLASLFGYFILRPFLNKYLKK